MCNAPSLPKTETPAPAPPPAQPAADVLGPLNPGGTTSTDNKTAATNRNGRATFRIDLGGVQPNIFGLTIPN
jgi:hypothetical protein